LELEISGDGVANRNDVPDLDPIRNDDRDRRDAPTHDHDRLLQGRLNGQCRLAHSGSHPALPTQTELGLEQKCRRQIRLARVVSCFLLGSHYRGKEESPDSPSEFLFESRPLQ
jgi:hypothetical protein